MIFVKLKLKCEAFSFGFLFCLTQIKSLKTKLKRSFCHILRPDAHLQDRSVKCVALAQAEMSLELLLLILILIYKLIYFKHV